MAITPRTRRRAINLANDGPVIPPSEQYARAYYRANKAKNLAAADEKKAYTEAHKAFIAEGRSRFEIVEQDKTVVVEIATQSDKNEIDMVKLYGLVASGDITLPKFVEVCKATQADVKRVLGTNVLASVLVGLPQEPKFVIADKKGD